MIINKPFSIRVGDLEVRSCNNSLTSKQPHTTAEIVVWKGTGCSTIARFKEYSEGFDLAMVSDRAFNYVGDSSEKAMEFFYMAKQGYDLLMNEYEQQEGN